MPNAATIERQVGEESPEVPPRPSPARSRRFGPPSMAALFGLCFALGAWAIEIRPLMDNSFLWHLKTGNQILDHGIPRQDIFSFTAPGVSWVAQSWLAEVLYAAIDRLAGPFGIRLFRGATSALIAYLAFRLAARLAGDRVRAALLTFVALGASFTLWAERPFLLGALGMVVLLWIVEVPTSFVGRHPRVSMPVLLWLWANIHGSFALGFAYLGLHLLGSWLDGRRPWQGRERALLAGTALGFGACLVNPLGVSLLTFPLHMLSSGGVLGEVLEWKSPDFHSLQGILFAAWIAVFVVTATRGRNRCSRRDLLVSGVFLLLGFWALRNLVLAPLVGLAVASRVVGVEPRPGRAMPLNWIVCALLVFLGGSAAVQAAGERHYDFSDYPVKAMGVVEERGLLGDELLTHDDWGAYVIHAYWPRQRVFIDDRYDMFPAKISREYFALNSGGEGWETILDRHGIDVIVWRNTKPLSRLLNGDAGWRRIHRDELASVWVRA